MKKFCHNCGQEAATHFKFCSSCGTGLDSLASTPRPAAKERPSLRPFTPNREDDDDDDEYIDNIDHLDIRINALEVDIVKDRPMGETFASVGLQPMAPREAENRPAAYPAQLSKEQFLAEFRKEAGLKQRTHE